VQGLTGKRGDPAPYRAAPLNGASATRAVDRITDQRMSTMGEMHPDLMCSAGGKTAFDKRRLRTERALYTIMRDCRPPLPLADKSHLFAVRGTAPDVAGDHAGVWGRQTPNECGIGPVDPAQGKVARQRVMGGLGLGDDHQTARILVETMNDTGSADPADPGKVRTTMADQRVYECAVWVSRRRVDNHPRGLIDDDQMCILKAYIQRDRLRYGRRICMIRENYDEILAAAHPRRWIAERPTFTRDIAGVDQAFEPRARQRRQMERKYAIKSLTDLASTRKDSCRGAAKGLKFSRHDQTALSLRSKGDLPV
jgi:hypothetical protein